MAVPQFIVELLLAAGRSVDESPAATERVGWRRRVSTNACATPHLKRIRPLPNRRYTGSPLRFKSLTTAIVRMTSHPTAAAITTPPAMRNGTVVTLSPLSTVVAPIERWRDALCSFT